MGKALYMTAKKAQDSKKAKTGHKNENRPKPESKLKPKSVRTQERIASKALGLFEAQGYRKTTIPAICKAAGVSRSTFFHYFKSKADILQGYRSTFADNLAEFAETLPKNYTAREKVRALLMYDAEQNLERGEKLRTAIVCSLDMDPEFRDSHDRVFTYTKPVYAKVLKESYPQADPAYCEKVALLITRVYWMTWRSCIFMRDDYDFKQELSDSLDIIWDGVNFPS